MKKKWSYLPVTITRQKCFLLKILQSHQDLERVKKRKYIDHCLSVTESPLFSIFSEGSSRGRVSNHRLNSLHRAHFFFSFQPRRIWSLERSALITLEGPQRRRLPDFLCNKIFSAVQLWRGGKARKKPLVERLVASIKRGNSRLLASIPTSIAGSFFSVFRNWISTSQEQHSCILLCDE